MKKLYIANMSAIKTEFNQTTFYGLFAIAEAENKHEAIGIILEECKNRYKESEGYYSQKISDVAELESVLPRKWYLVGEKQDDTP